MKVLRVWWATLVDRWRRWRALRRVDRRVFTYEYVGPTNRWGLRTGAPIRLLHDRGHAGGLTCVTPDGRRWTIAREHLRIVS